MANPEDKLRDEIKAYDVATLNDLLNLELKLQKLHFNEMRISQSKSDKARVHSRIIRKELNKRTENVASSAE